MLKTIIALFTRKHRRVPDRRTDAWTQLIGRDATQLWLEALSARDHRPIHT